MGDRLILGIDPGMARTGYGLVRQSGDGSLVLVDYGTVTTRAGEELGPRLVSLEEGILHAIESRRPDTAGIEKLFFERNVTTAMSVGQARGVAVLTLTRLGIPIEEYAPAEIKDAVAGYGAADKRQMQTMVRMLLAMETTPQPDDAADALAIAICHAQASRARARLAAAK
jgi:crossover junction endodeoxyribonuclease RuvC